MSDTEFEVVPDSQMADTEMISLSQEEQEERTASQMSAVEHGTLDEHLSCGICLSLMDNPFMVLPCMHSYDRECIAEWWRSNNNCPVCKQRSSAAKYNFHLANIIYQYRKDTNRPFGTELGTGSHEDLYPMGRRFLAPQSLPSSYGYSQSQSQSQSQFQSQSQLGAMLLIPGIDDFNINSQSQSQPVLAPLADPFPGGNLVFPCPSCPAQNNTSHVCPEPIPMPTDEQIAAEQQAYRPGGTPLRAPGRGEPHVPLQAARLNGLPGAAAHNACRACSTYIPAGWEPAKQTCADCGVILCCNYDPRGCPEGRQLRPRHSLASDTVTAHALWETCPGSLRLNTTEMRRFQDYIATHGITIDNILEHFAETERRNEINPNESQNSTSATSSQPVASEERLEEANRRWGPDVYLCDEAIQHLVRGRRYFYTWWIEERSRARLPASVTNLSDCWYGNECRTQARPDHAARYNHVCPNTSQANRDRTS